MEWEKKFCEEGKGVENGTKKLKMGNYDNKERKKLNGHAFKLMMKSRAAEKSKRSDLSVKKTEEGSISKPNGSSEDETSQPDSSFSRTERYGVDFLLRRVEPSGNEEISNGSSDATVTHERRNSMLESQSNLVYTSKLTEKSEDRDNGSKSVTINFLEYWVPVKLSNVQTEQYCGSLFSNANLLCSSVKLGLSNKLQDILVSTTKCCDHPYLVDRSLRTSLIQGIPQPEQLDAEIKLSNKLLLLHKILLEIKKRGLRVLLLYRSRRSSGQISTGDVLDDIIHEKFGDDSFVRIDGWVPSKRKRKDILNTFNEKGSAKFVCLMDTHFCCRSLKLSSVDTVIFFNSDWNPMNDIKALQRINLDSQFEQVKVFRLYSCYTVEEKALILSKQGSPPEGCLMSMKQSTCHDLLTWGTSYLMKKMDEFHASTASDACSVIEEGSFVDDVFLELSSLLPNGGESGVCTNNTLVLEVQQVGGVYPQNISLLGEVQSPLMDDISSEPLCFFWTKLLEGRNPRWKYFSSQSPRIRKTPHFFDSLPEEPEEVATEAAPKKCRTEETSPIPQISAVIRRRNIIKVRREHKRRKLSAGKENDQHGQKCKSDLREKIASWIKGQRKASELARMQTPTLGNQSSAEQHSEHPVPHEPDVPDHPVLDAAGLLPDGSVGPWEHCQSSMNCQLPQASQGSHSDALQSACKSLEIELEELEKQKTECLKQHEEMKLQTKMAFEKEVDELRKKYDIVLQNAELAFLEKRECIQTRYKKIYNNKSLAEAVLQTHTSIGATLKEGLCSSVTVQASTVDKSNQTSAPAIVASESHANPCANAVHPMLSLQVVPAFRSSVAAGTNQSLSIPSINAPQLLPNLAPNFSRNIQASCQLRSPAPHLRNIWRPLAVTAPKTSNAQQPLL